MATDQEWIKVAKAIMDKHAFSEDYLEQEQFQAVIDYLEQARREAVETEEYEKAALVRDWVKAVGDMMLGYDSEDGMNIVYTVCCDKGEVVDAYKMSGDVPEWCLVFKFGGCFYQFTVDDWSEYQKAVKRIKKKDKNK